MMKYTKIIAIDFDGTIVGHAFPAIGELRPGAVSTIKALYDRGHGIIIWTCRTEKEHIDDMIQFLHDAGIRFHAINHNLTLFTPYPKVYADLYIDDRNLFHKHDWMEIAAELKRLGYL